jgi:hypothetical protein
MTWGSVSLLLGTASILTFVATLVVSGRTGWPPTAVESMLLWLLVAAWAAASSTGVTAGVVGLLQVGGRFSSSIGGLALNGMLVAVFVWSHVTRGLPV